MKIIADLHLHSKYSQATSKDLDLENLEKYARIKGVTLLGTGDFTHPKWIANLKEKLTEDETGILRTKSGFPFLLTTELSFIYSQDGKGRRVHNVVLAKNFDIVDQIIETMGKVGRLDYDGRPIFGIPCYDFVQKMKRIDDSIEIIPAHIWTPWFSVFGSSSGFNSIQECFKDQAKHIHALETGLSSDPAMNWRLSMLDKYSLVSFSDAHSFWPWRIGREATIFDLKEFTYDNLIHALRTKEGLSGTIEFWPHEGKYHYDGHRACNVCMHPSDAIKSRNMCPVCGKQLTIGVAHRVEELADRPEGFRPKDAKPFTNLIPFSECIAGVLGSPVASKKVWTIFNKAIETFGNEFNILLDAPEEDLRKHFEPELADAILRNRNQQIEVTPGYDGVYGVPVFGEKTASVKNPVITKPKHQQKGISDFF